MSKKAFTLIELLIVIAILALVVSVAIALLNPLQEFGRADDARRKADLNTLRKSFEDYYNDKGCYPTAAQVCSDSPISQKQGVGASAKTVSYTCHICGLASSTPSFAPYLSRLPCDPQHPQKDYLYQYDGKSTCPGWNRIYSNLSITDDPASLALGCLGGGCGPAPNYGYSYGVASPNYTLESTSVFVCIVDGICNYCGSSYSNCLKQPSCDLTKIYPSSITCCAANPGGCIP